MKDPDAAPWETEIERTKSGSPIYRYEKGHAPASIVGGDRTLIAAVDSHIDRHFPGSGQWVFHELVSSTVHVDIHVIPPADERPYFTLVTTGLAQKAMHPPSDVEGCRYAELVALLPADWPGLQDPSVLPGTPGHPWHDEANYWPIRWLKILSRFPHDYNTWIWLSHSMPNGDPPAPFAANTKLSGLMLDYCWMLPPDFSKLKVDDERDLTFLALTPLHADELQYKLDQGFDAINKLMDAHNVSLVIDPARRSVVSGYTRPGTKRR